jgi:hypothetical protein
MTAGRWWASVAAAAAGFVIAAAVSASVPQPHGTVARTPHRLFETTFTDPAETARWSQFIGRWQSGSTELVLLARSPFGGRPADSLFGAMPHGPREGVLSLSRHEADAWRGSHVDLEMRQRPALMARNPDGTLTLELEGLGPLRFRRTAHVNLPLLRSINIICHRGLSLNRASLANSLVGIRHSALFGCSGVELDVTVPHDAQREPVVAGLRVYHPPEWRSEITGFDSVPEASVAASPTLPEALAASREAGVPFVYLDPKIQWLITRKPDGARRALDRIAADAGGHLSRGVRQTIAIGSAGSGAAAETAGSRKSNGWPQDLVWALELTRGSDDRGAIARLRHADRMERPEIASVNLLRVPGGGGGWLRLFVPSIARDVEHQLTHIAQPVIFWTAHDEAQFNGALLALDRIRGGTTQDAGVITPFPHRLAFYLATRARSRQ